MNKDPMDKFSKKVNRHLGRMREEINDLAEFLEIPGWTKESTRIRRELLEFFENYLDDYFDGVYDTPDEDGLIHVDHEFEALRLYEYVCKITSEAYEN